MKPRAFSLIAVLLLSTLLLVLATAFLAKQAFRYKGARAETDRVAARGLAWAGLEAARVRLDQDFQFPPVLETDLPQAQFLQKQYTFQENLLDVDGVRVVGAYEVTCEYGWQDAPYGVLRITSWGKPANSSAQCRIRAEYDVSETVRGTTNPNPELWKLIQLEEDP